MKNVIAILSVVVAASLLPLSALACGANTTRNAPTTSTSTSPAATANGRNPSSAGNSTAAAIGAGMAR